MSKGPGRVQRIIAAAFAAEPDNAFTTTELCERVYPDENDPWFEKKHRIAVVRAAKKLPQLDHLESEMLGSQLVFFDRGNVMSYAMARLKADSLNNYRNEDSRNYGQPRTEADLRKMLADDRHRELVAEGGAWWLHTEIAKAVAGGDRKRAAALQKRLDRATAAVLKSVGASIKRLKP
jgi:hypothetical protein